MKTLLFLVLLCAVALSFSMTSVGRANPGQKQRATVIFTEPVDLRGVTLKGEYLFVHDDEAMARGEACTYVYKGNAEVPDRLVTSFHCIPSATTKAKSFKVTTRELAPGIVELTAYQFAGDTETHLVPPSK